MAPVAFGEAFTPEDRAYRGSRFREVRETLFRTHISAFGVDQASRRCRCTRLRCAAFSKARYDLASAPSFTKRANGRSTPS